MILQRALLLALVAVIVYADDCANDYAQYFSCLDTKFDGDIEKFLKPVDKKQISQEAATCFTTNGCKAPEELSKAIEKDEATDSGKESEGDDNEDDEDRPNDMFSIGYEALLIKKILNPKWFPVGKEARNVTPTDEECIAQQDGLAASMVEKCVQGKLPGFKFPDDGGLPTKMDYMQTTVDVLAGVDSTWDDASEFYIRSLRDKEICPSGSNKKAEECIGQLFKTKQMTSFERLLETEKVFKSLCQAGLECYKETKEPCKKWITDASKISCECAESEKTAIVDALVERYKNCFNLEPMKDAISKAYSAIVKRRCAAFVEDKQQCIDALQSSN